jgi:hypothetical protein
MSSQNLFSTVAPDDLLAFGRGADFSPKRVADWMDLNKGEVSKIASVAKASVRYDEDAPKAVVDRLEEIANIANIVAGIFDGDAAKAALWFRTKNPMLGDVAPRDMVRLGRYDRLRKFIVTAIVDRVPQRKVA